MYVCLCMGLTESDIREQIRTGARTLDDLARISGAGSDCEACLDRLLVLIAEETARSEAAAPVDAPSWQSTT